MGRQLRPVQFSDLVAFVDREARILANSFFGKISDTIRSAPGQRFSGGKTFLFKNLRLLANVGDSEGPTNETVPQGVKDPSQLAYGEQRPHTRKIQPSGIDQGGGRGGFQISHDASLHTILSSFGTHVILSVQHGRDS